MPVRPLSEDLQKLFKELLLQKSMEDERKLLQKNGFDVNEKVLEAFHQKKLAFWAAVKSQQDVLKKLDKDALEKINGGTNWLTAVLDKIEETINFVDTIKQIFNIVDAVVHGANIRAFLAQILQEQINGMMQENMWNTAKMEGGLLM